MNLLDFSKKMVAILFIFTGFLLILAQNTAYAASITVSPPKHEFEVEAGGSATGIISITNGDAEDLVLEWSVADFSAQGESGVPKFSEHEDISSFSMSSWIELVEGDIKVKAGEKIDIPFMVSIPEDAESGGHFGTIFFSPKTSDAQGVSIKQKVGVLLLVRVAGEVIERSELSIFGAYGENIEPNEVANARPKKFFQKFPINFAVRLTNTGNVHIKPSGTITIKNMFGSSLARVGEKVEQTETGAVTGKKLVDYIPVNDAKGNVLPSSSRVFLSKWSGYGSMKINSDGKQEIAWQGIGFGRYTAELDLSYSDINFPKQEVHFWIIPWMIVLPSVAGLIALIIIARYWRAASRGRLKRKLLEEIKQEKEWT